MQTIWECIEAIGSIMDGLTMEPNKLAQFTEQYNKLAARSKDPLFYLSTIGDFSSGKSTLINTLLKRKLLKVAHAATTAVPTYIYRGQGDLAVKVKCDDGNVYDISSETEAATFAQRFGLSLPEALDERISLLTADRVLSLKMKEVDIELPEDALTSDLCIIDTPGINPGADYAEKHEEITRQILNEKADGIIILFPADQAYTQSFEKFLKDNAAYFMKDAIFVVTMIDRVDEEERDDVIRFVKTNLRNNFQIPNPQVLSCSAMRSGKDPYWAENFREFERALRERLAQNRQRIVMQKLLMLANELLSEIQWEMTVQKSAFEERLRVLQSCSVPNLMTVLEEIRLEAVKELYEIRTNHDQAVAAEGAYLPDKIMTQVTAGLNTCNTRSAVTKYVNEAMTADIEGACTEIYGQSTRYTGMLNGVVDKSNSRMLERLVAYYGKIGDVQPECTGIAAADNGIAIADKLTGLGDMMGQHEGSMDVATALGGAGLAAIILTGLGPVGWIIGGFAALVGGDRLFVDSARGKVRTAVSEKTHEITASVVQGLSDGMLANYGKARGLVAARKDWFIAHYQPVYQKISNELEMEKQDIMQKINHSEATQNRIIAVLMQIHQMKEMVSDE